MQARPVSIVVAGRAWPPGGEWKSRVITDNANLTSHIKKRRVAGSGVATRFAAFVTPRIAQAIRLGIQQRVQCLLHAAPERHGRGGSTIPATASRT